MKRLKKSYLTIALALSTCGVLFQNCAAAPPPDIGSMTGASTSVGGANATCSFAGRILLNNETVVAYQTNTVAAGGTCNAQVRTCNSGILVGSFEFGSCTVQSPTATASCNFYGQTVAHGGSVTAYQSSSVTGGSCVAQNRVCTNGTLDGTYQYSSCVVDCAFNGALVKHGETVDAFQSASVPNGSSCVLEKRTCNMGALSGSFTNSSCSVLPANLPPPANCSFNGQTVLHGGSVTAYSTDVAPFGSVCNAYAETRTCNDGRLGGSYTFSYCEREIVDNCYGYPQPYLRYQEARPVCP